MEAAENSTLPSLQAQKSSEFTDIGLEDRLYRDYLSGGMSFEDLMKELHRKTNLDGLEKISRKSSRRRTRASVKNQPKKVQSEFEDSPFELGSYFFYSLVAHTLFGRIIQLLCLF